MLLTDNNAWTASRGEIQAVPVPEITASYRPVPHLEFLREVHNQLSHNGLRAVTEDLALGRSGDQLFGVLGCENGRSSDAHRLSIGIRNSYDRSLACGLVAGFQVLVCSNLAFSGEVSMSRRHTKNVHRDLPYLIEEMIGQVLELRIRQDGQIEDLKSRDLSEREAHHLMIRAVRTGAFPASKIPRVIQEWDEPRHQEFQPRTAWSLLNAFTEVSKQRSASSQMDVGLMRVFAQA